MNHGSGQRRALTATESTRAVASSCQVVEMHTLANVEHSPLLACFYGSPCVQLISLILMHDTGKEAGTSGNRLLQNDVCVCVLSQPLTSPQPPPPFFFLAVSFSLVLFPIFIIIIFLNSKRAPIGLDGRLYIKAQQHVHLQINNNLTHSRSSVPSLPILNTRRCIPRSTQVSSRQQPLLLSTLASTSMMASMSIMSWGSRHCHQSHHNYL